MRFELIGPVTDLEPIAKGRGIRKLAELQRMYGRGRWRKLKGKALVRGTDGFVYLAEVHWYEAHGLGRHLLKVKRVLEKREP